MSTTSKNLDLAGDLYRAFADKDAAALAGLLHPSFTGEVSAGMPLGVGGHVEGPLSMLRDVWGRIFAAYDVTPLPSELVPAEDGRVFVIGRYRGRVRDGGGEVDAAFVHVLSFADDRLASLLQVTDTARWAAARPASAR